MPGSNSDLPLFNTPSTVGYGSTSVDHNLLPISSSKLFDISDDNKFLALIDDSSKIQVYEINHSGNEMTFKMQTMKDISSEIYCTNLMFVYISVASVTGYAAVSFLQLERNGETLKRSTLFNRWNYYMFFQINDNENHAGDKEEMFLNERYVDYRIYRTKDDITKIPFQGRAVFTRDKLVLIGRWSLDICKADTFEKIYSFKSGDFYLDNYTDLTVKSCYQFLGWENFCGPDCAEGHAITNISAHIRKNVVVVYENGPFGVTKTSVKIWSITIGLLICSFTRSYDEHIVFISEDQEHGYLVTKVNHSKLLNIYFIKSGTHMHTYQPQGVKENPENSTIDLVKHMKSQPYILIVGTKSRQNEERNKNRLFFEIYSLAHYKYIKYTEHYVPIHEPGFRIAYDISQETCFPYFPFKFQGMFLERTDNYCQKLAFKTFPLIDTELDGLHEETLWSGFSFKPISTGNWDSEKEGILSHRLDCDCRVINYLLEKGDYKFVLRISSHLTQLWRLKIAGNDEKEPFNFGTSFSDNQEMPKYYGTVAKSSLIYTRSYYGMKNDRSYIHPPGSFEVQYFKSGKKPRVRFTTDKERILVHVDSIKPGQTVEEVKLPLLKSNGKTLPKSKDDFYSIESCLLTLLFLYHQSARKIPWGGNIQHKEMIKKTKDLLLSILLSNDKTTYFQTISASDILMGLAIYDKEQGIILDVILKKEFSIAIFNYAFEIDKLMTTRTFSFYSKPTDQFLKANILIIFVQRNQFDLLQLLFNQAILDYYNGRLVDLFPLMDAVIYLSERNKPELFLRCMDKLSYLPVDIITIGIPDWELYKIGKQKSIKTFTIFHQMKKHIPGALTFYADKIVGLFYQPGSIKKERAREDAKKPESYFISNQVCVIPLSTPCIYNAISDAILDRNSPYSSTDPLNQTLNLRLPIIDILLKYKWRNYMEGPFYIILFIQIIFNMVYTLAISFPEEMFDYTPGSPIQHRVHLICLVTLLLTWILLVIEEVAQMINLKWRYWKSVYNYVDLIAVVFPLITSILLFTDSFYLYDVSSLTTLILWIHFLLRLRAIRRIGILIEIIIQLGIKIVPIIGLMILIIVAFTHSFSVLLRRQDDRFFQEQFQGNVVLENNNSLGQSVIISDQSQQNLFKDPFLAFSTVWFFLYGIFDPILSGDVGNYPMALVLAILFSFITALVILNVVIALMTGAIDETERKGNRNWYVFILSFVGTYN